MKFTSSLLLCCIAFLHTSAQFAYINPKPGSQYRNPQTNIILKNGNLIDRSSVSGKNLVEISGSASGRHSWTARLSDDNKTVVIKPSPVFDFGETVTVTVNSGLRKMNGEKVEGFTFIFQIRNKPTPEDEVAYAEMRKQSLQEVMGYSSAEKNPDDITYPLDSMPVYVISVNNNPAPGQIFYRNKEDQTSEVPNTNSFATIIENDGTILWARDLGQFGADFKLNANGYMTYFADTAQWMVLDSNYNLIDSVRCKNGYELETQGHDVMMYPDGHVFLMAYDLQTINMTAYGGISNAKVQGFVVQELDANRDVVFEWTSWDHFLFTDANSHTPLTNSQVDYVHGNSIDRDFDGNIIISSRNMDEITKISHETGEIIWRLGGENNQFTFVNDNIPQHFSSQHDARRLPNGNILLFNNGNYLSPLISSAKEYMLDEVNKVATLVWYYEHPDVNGFKVYGAATGNAQRLPNGNTIINWGLIAPNVGLPNHTEVDVNKNIVWEMSFESSKQKCYRIHKYEWNPCSRITGYTMKSKKITPTSATVSWGDATGASSYKVQRRALGTSDWKSKTTSAAKLKLNNLAPATTYEWRVLTKCTGLPDNTSAYSSINTFTTPPLKNAESDIAETTLLTVYPVPAADQITIVTNASGQVALTIRNMIGEVMYYHKSISGKDGPLQLDVQQWPAGVYIAEVSDGSHTAWKKLVKE
ncbi:MAG: aryl-sulfate sulfotransferase [Chitinophagales bacterium]|nr:aryl-sulfate sulfotransferase [Chitinophagales bacterium]